MVPGVGVWKRDRPLYLSGEFPCIGDAARLVDEQVDEIDLVTGSVSGGRFRGPCPAAASKESRASPCWVAHLLVQRRRGGFLCEHLVIPTNQDNALQSNQHRQLQQAATGDGSAGRQVEQTVKSSGVVGAINIHWILQRRSRVNCLHTCRPAQLTTFVSGGKARALLPRNNRDMRTPSYFSTWTCHSFAVKVFELRRCSRDERVVVVSRETRSNMEIRCSVAASHNHSSWMTTRRATVMSSPGDVSLAVAWLLHSCTAAARRIWKRTTWHAFLAAALVPPICRPWQPEDAA